jgi:hypothetical protein
MNFEKQMNDTIASVLITLDTRDNTEVVSAPTASLSSFSVQGSKRINYATSSEHSTHEERKVCKQVKGAFPNGSRHKPSSFSSTS